MYVIQSNAQFAEWLIEARAEEPMSPCIWRFLQSLNEFFHSEWNPHVVGICMVHGNSIKFPKDT